MAEFLLEKKRDRDAEAAAAAPKSNRIARLGLLAAVATGAWCFPFPPPSEPREVPFTVKQAGVRMEVFRAAQRVRLYRAQFGKLPSTLSRAGVSEAWLSFQPLDSVEFEITGRTDGVQATYRSMMTDSVFLRDTRRLLGGSAS